jgi:hypothetical protein
MVGSATLVTLINMLPAWQAARLPGWQRLQNSALSQQLVGDPQAACMHHCQGYTGAAGDKATIRSCMCMY